MSQPSRRRKVAFWILAGMISVVFVEVPAGSTMFPFFTVWDLLVVLPLYLLHVVFLGGVVFRSGWTGVILGRGVATAVTTTSRLCLYRFAAFQALLLFPLYVVCGLLLFAGTLFYIGKRQHERL